MNTIKLLRKLQGAWRVRRSRMRPRPLLWAMALAGVATHTLGPLAGAAHAQALPAGLNVVRGQATLAQTGNQLTVTNSAGAVLNWQSFNIGAANAVRFEQPSASSKVLNRVVGANPSQIFGSLTSNGEVWLVNPYGVLFGRDARVNVGALVVSTLGIGDEAWKAGRFSLTGGAGNTAPIVNQGELRSTTGGRVLLLAGAGGVRNEGLIASPDGQVALAAGSAIDLADGETRNLAVRVQAPQGQVLNLGSVAAGGGRVDLAAAMVNQQGLVRAESLAGIGGEIVLKGSEGVTLAAGSVTSAAGASGGSVTVDGGAGTTMLAGEVNVTGSAAKGGEALVLGQRVGLLDGALVDASGAAGGGRVRVGGGLRGEDPSVTNSQAVWMGPGMQIRADATGRGDGGTIVLWSDQATRAYGSLSARGGALGGDGGFIETSSHWLDAQPASVRTEAVNGRAGTWLLDPNNITISDFANGDFNVTTGPNFTTTNDGASLRTSTINSALAAGNNVVVTTGTGGNNGQSGTISVSGARITSGSTGSPVSLTLNAVGDIVVTNSTISNINGQQVAGDPLSVVLNAGTGGLGAVLMRQSTISTGGGDITIGGPTVVQGPNIKSPQAGAVGHDSRPGVEILGTTLDAGSGSVRISGQGTSFSAGDGGPGSAIGVLISSYTTNFDGIQVFPTTIRGRNIDIFGWADVNDSVARRGVVIGDPTTNIIATHSLGITGVANSKVYFAGGEGEEPIGVDIVSGNLAVTPPANDATASLRISGTANDAPATGPGELRVGVQMATGTVVTAQGKAAVNITGTDGQNDPVTSASVVSGASLQFGLAGDATISGNTRVTLSGFIDSPRGQSLTMTAGDVLSLTGLDIQGGATALSLTGREIRLQSSSIFLDGSDPTAVSLTATNDIRLENSRIDTEGGEMSITFTAAAGNSGRGVIELSDFSLLYSGGGDIVLGGGSIATSGAGTSARAGALATGVGDVGIGVSLSDSTVDAGGGTLRIVGQSTSASSEATGVAIFQLGEGSSRLFGGVIDIYGWSSSNAAVPRTGVLLDRFSAIQADAQATITGLALSTLFAPGDVAPIGVNLQGDLAVSAFLDFGGPLTRKAPATIRVPINEAPPPVNGSLVINGTTQDGARGSAVEEPSRYGVLFGPESFIAVSLGSTTSITGVDLSPNNEIAVRLAPRSADFSGGGDVSVRGQGRVELGSSIFVPFGGAFSAQSTTTLSLQSDANISGDPLQASFRAGQLLELDGSVNFTSAAALDFIAPSIDLGGSGFFSAVTAGPMRLLTDHYRDLSSSTLSSSAAGTAIVIAGADGQSNTTSIELGSEPGFSTVNGRWLIYLKDDAFTGSGLNVDFLQYGLTYPATPVALGTGNGIAYSLQPTATLVNTTPISKVYDGTNTVLDSEVGFDITGLRPGHFAFAAGEGIGLAYPGTAAGDNQKLVVSGVTGIVVSDQFERPVYGYLNADDVRGDITRRALTLTGTTAADKVYDGTRTATMVGGTLTGLLTGETLGLSYRDSNFVNPSVGNGKLVTSDVDLVNGTGLAGNYVITVGNSIRTTASITPRPLTLSGVTASDKVYDGTLGATVAGGTLANLVSGETLTLLLGGGQFDSANVGNGRLVSGTATVQDGSTGLASNYTLAGAFTATAAVTPRTLTVTGVTAANKVYDGTRSATLAGGTLTNLVSGETLALTLAGGQFDTANAGTGKAVSGTATLGNGSGLASNYVLAAAGAVGATADITPRTVTVDNLSAGSRVYDGTRGVTLSGGTISGLVGNETLGLQFANAQLVTAGVGTNKPVTADVSLANGTGLASNYRLSAPEGAYASSAAVTPASLQYVAQPLTLTPAQFGVAYTGTVTGFVGGDTLASATQGTLAFTSPATAGSAPGSYAINGSGLTAANYTLTQAAGNASALTLLPAQNETVGLPEIEDVTRAVRLALPPLPRPPESVRALDALQSLRVDPTWLSMAFGELDLDKMSREEVAALLEARRQYKMSILRVAREQLEADPSLADVPACQTVKQSESGRCLVTAELLAAVEAQGENAQIVVPPPAPRPTPAPVAAPAPAPVAGAPSTPSAPASPPAAPPVAAAPTPAPSPVPGTPAAPAVVAAAPAAPAVQPRVPPRVRVAAQPELVAPALPAARTVRNASIPQIQRKIAVLVGIDNYVDERIPALENARRDVDAVAKVLESRLGYETVIVRDAGREAMVGVLNKLALQTRPNDSVVVYYAGHGTVVDGTSQGYWIPATADAEKPESWLSNRDIARLLGSIRAQQVVLISDSCFSGSLVGDKRIQVAGSDPRALLQRRATVVMSSGGDEPVADGATGGHSPFSTSLMATLQGLDNWRVGGNVYDKVREDVTRRLPQTPRYGPARDARHAEGGDYLFEQRELGAR